MINPLNRSVSYHVGVSKADITPSDWQTRTYWLAGFGLNRPATSVNDPLFARAMVIDDGTTPFAIVTLDLLGLTSVDVEQVQKAIAAQVPELGDRILIHATHTHEAPDTVGLWGGAGSTPFANPRPLDYIEAIASQSAKAVAEAWSLRQPTTVKVANIDQTALKDLVVDSRPPTVYDPAARLLVFSNGDQVVGSLVNWASHPEVLGSENQAITADFVKWLIDEMDTQLGGQTLFVNGAIGGLLTSESRNILPNLPRRSFEKAEAVGREVAKRLLQQINNPSTTDLIETYDTLPPIQYRTRTFYLPIENPIYLLANAFGRVPAKTYRQDEIPLEERRRDANSSTLYVQTEVTFVDFGSISILTMGGELYPQLLVGGIDPSIGIAPYNTAPLEVPLVNNPEWASDPFKFFFGLTNDFLGYFVPQAEWDGWSEGFYGEEFSPAPDAGSILSQNLHLLLSGYETGEYARTAYANTIDGGLGSDTLNGTPGDDILNGYQGSDLLLGNGGNDTLFGGRGQDILRGGDGADKLYGKDDADILHGNTGNDLLLGGLGEDTLTGGAGRDRFIYYQLNEGQDVITDFTPTRDRIDLSRIFDHPLYTSSSPFEDYIRLVQNGADAIVQVDTNGGIPDSFQPLVTLVNVAIDQVSVNQFIV
jgi:RTX calcium-binding nonapeptide repeat (4 copies)